MSVSPWRKESDARRVEANPEARAILDTRTWYPPVNEPGAPPPHEVPHEPMKSTTAAQEMIIRTGYGSEVDKNFNQRMKQMQEEKEQLQRDLLEEPKWKEPQRRITGASAYNELPFSSELLMDEGAEEDVSSSSSEGELDEETLKLEAQLEKAV